MAFELPHVRAAATETLPPPDRISVRDYVRSVEIGAFSAERGVAQRVRFNVVLEVRRSVAAEDDDVDKVVSYDTITDAIEAELAFERINLLETLAERVARRCLADPRALRVFVRVEKLDRGPGALGVEIVRVRSEGVRRLRPAAPAEPVAAPRPVVVYLPNAAVGPDAARWRDVLAAARHAIVAALDPLEPQPPAAATAARRVGLLSIDQNVWGFAADDPRLIVATSRTEIEHGLRSSRPVIWAPAKLVMDAVRPPLADASAPGALAAWLATEIGATLLVSVGAPAAPAADLRVKAVGATPPDLMAALERSGHG